jgi:diguanylate cyclase (GGDEF)-like protein
MLSFTAWLLISRWEDRHAQVAFNVVAENHFMVLQNGLTEYLNKLRALRALFDSSDDEITRREFEAFSRPLLQSNSAVQTLSWVPRVLRSERIVHEAKGAGNDVLNYQIKSHGSDGTVVRSAEQDEYFPIFYATVPKESRLYGLDLRSEPDTLRELEQARDGDQLGFSQVPELLSASGRRHGFIFSLPVYQTGSPHGTVEERRHDLVGFVHGSFITSEMIDNVLTATTTPQGVDLFFFTPGTESNASPMYVHGSRLRTQPSEPMSQTVLLAGPRWSRELVAGNKPWMTLVAAPMPGGPFTAGHERAWIVLVSVLIITASMVAYIGGLRRYALRLVRANERVSELAERDALTGLANRRAFLDHLTLAFAQLERGAEPFAVLYFDLDDFKDVNDTLGHPAGDELLRQVTGRVTKTVREIDLVARFGGDEFAILQSNIPDPSAAGTLATTINKIIAAPYIIDGNEVHITASIGISIYSLGLTGPAAMMIQADLALYRAKEDGRNCFRFHNSELDRQVQERVTIAEELRVALDRDEFELHYQPQVEIASGRILGLEALLRWNHPKRGLVSPTVFIPIAERSGHILALGQWAFNEACRQLKLWQEQDIAPKLVAVNFSAFQFKAVSDLEREISASLEHWDIAPEMMEMELTESVLMEVTQQHSESLQRFRRLGLQIAIDDFGTGFSSLTYLTNYPVNRLKIAQELVFRVTDDARNATVVRAAIRLAAELGIEVIAEGVETSAQAEFLLSAGCEHAQGYYFSRPLNAPRVTELLRLGTIQTSEQSVFEPRAA